MKAILTLLFLLQIAVIHSASRYCVTAAWNGTSNWASISGGTANKTAPTSTDIAYFDGASPATVTLSTTGNCSNLVCTGYTGTITSSGGAQTLNIYGSMTLVSGMTWTQTNITIVFKSTATGKTITTAGKTMYSITFDGVGGGWTLQDNTVIADGAAITLTNGTFNTGGKSITPAATTGAWDFVGTDANTKTLTMGASTITLVGTGCTNTTKGIWNFGSSALSGTTITANTSVITCGQFSGADRAWNSVIIHKYTTLTANVVGTTAVTIGTLELVGTATYIQESFTVTTFIVDAGTTVYGTSGKTLTCTNITMTGTSGSHIVIGASTTSAWTISKASGTVLAYYTDFSYCTGTGGATWCAGLTCTDGGHNTGWVFTACPSTSPGSLWFGCPF
jgi:hypothetical protein